MVGKRAMEKTNRRRTKKTKHLHETEEHTSNPSASNQEPHPIGEVLRFSDDGVQKKNHFQSFQFEGRHFQLEDYILVAPEDKKTRPYVTIIKDIYQAEGGSLMISAQRFYRPNQAQKKEGGTWESNDARDLFYSHHMDEYPANSVMHKCVIHFLPLHEPMPDRKQKPGFIVRKSYDYVQQKVRNLNDEECNRLSNKESIEI